ncbi:MAG: ABC transporter ATP-binding protein [Candidatus Tectomicrobia bacterium]|nr:ABC transporter ATP-binding protein [Candidatus Tectomicrobia bacterium]
MAEQLLDATDATRVMIRGRNIVKRFGSTTAVDGVTFEVMRGETYGLLGPNGAGKTTLMRLLSALSPLSDGELAVGGLDVTGQARAVRARLGVVTQQDGLDSDLTVQQNLETYGYFSGLSRRRSRLRACEVLSFFGLDDRAGDDVAHLSGGMKRRLAIARAFIMEPEVIILDEPTTGLDPQGRNLVWSKLAALKASGVTILMSTHYMEEAANLCDRIAVMHLGRILDEGTPGELIERHTTAEVAQVRAPAAAMVEIRAALTATGCPWREVGTVVHVLGHNGHRPQVPSIDGVRVTYRPGNLEDVFLAVAGRALGAQ